IAVPPFFIIILFYFKFKTYPIMMISYIIFQQRGVARAISFHQIYIIYRKRYVTSYSRILLSIQAIPTILRSIPVTCYLYLIKCISRNHDWSSAEPVNIADIMDSAHKFALRTKRHSQIDASFPIYPFQYNRLFLFKKYLIGIDKIPVIVSKLRL